MNRKWEDNIKIDLRETGPWDVVWAELTYGCCSEASSDIIQSPGLVTRELAFVSFSKLK
jgi:hypothetical protein